jgi:hypothetical protein
MEVQLSDKANRVGYFFMVTEVYASMQGRMIDRPPATIELLEICLSRTVYRLIRSIEASLKKSKNVKLRLWVLFGALKPFLSMLR